MSNGEHHYQLHLKWIGNRGTGTTDFTGYGRDHEYRGANKPVILGSSDPSFQGDPTRWNPEELLLASIASCHKLWYLHLCFDAGVNVVAYEDDATATMTENADGSGQFRDATLHPRVTISAGSDSALARRLHSDVHKFCFIARSVNFPIHHKPVIGKERT